MEEAVNTHISQMLQVLIQYSYDRNSPDNIKIDSGGVSNIPTRSELTTACRVLLLFPFS